MTVGEWILQPALNRVTRGQRSVHLEPKVMAVLTLLARRPGEVVTRQEILAEVWEGRCVDESVVTRAIARLRRTFSDDRPSYRYIETIPTRGYRLIAQVVSPENESESGLALIHEGREIPLRQGENVVGRAPEAAIRIPSTRVSRMHARVTVDKGHAVIEDLGSKNGTTVRGETILGPTELVHGDEICLGTEILVFRETVGRGTTETLESSRSGQLLGLDLEKYGA